MALFFGPSDDSDWSKKLAVWTNYRLAPHCRNMRDMLCGMNSRRETNVFVVQIALDLVLRERSLLTPFFGFPSGNE